MLQKIPPGVDIGASVDEVWEVMTNYDLLEPEAKSSVELVMSMVDDACITKNMVKLHDVYAYGLISVRRNTVFFASVFFGVGWGGDNNKRSLCSAT